MQQPDDILNDESSAQDPSENRRNELDLDALRSVLSSRQGRRFLWNLMGKCGLGKNPFTGDNNATNFNCGRQSVATDLLTDIDAINGSAYSLMSKEAQEDKTYVNGTSKQRPDGEQSNVGGYQQRDEYSPI